eukprot:TRINITY_DN2240_c0_g1_i6.p1 TRINITY_DN2240_c0_g1~~TRINITY_DN2240_c0_g1_i6.p1  ORF type:complete len:181 (-),score=60.17 TRINITY_DN2240_c0_g1_i6:123-665(-)
MCIRDRYKINKSAAKKLSKEYAIAAYKEMLEGGGEVVVPQGAEGEQVEANVTAVAVSAAEEGVKKKKEKLYKKKIMKKGAGKESIPKKGTTVRCHYVGKLEDGTVFDKSKTGKKSQPLSFKVGMGKVIKGWDEALLTMSVGEVAQITIEPEWAYGKKGYPEAKIPPNARLIFEVELVSYD